MRYKNGVPVNVENTTSNNLKNKTLILSIILLFIVLLPLQTVHAATDLENMINLEGPKKQYNTMLSPAYLRNNASEESISPQSGNITLAQTDYVLPGINGLDLEIKRIYSSGSANVRDMKAEYIDGVWVDEVYADNNVCSFYEDRYDLGVGMRFSFPSMEIKKNEDGTSYRFLHTESGDVYTLANPEKVEGINTYGIENQTVEDVKIKDSSEFSNGQSDGTSFYVMTNKSGKRTYFAEDGSVLGIEDRYGNKIIFKYKTQTYTIDGNIKTKKLLSEIIDTMGRTVKLEYKEEQSFTAGAIENKTYTLEDSYKAMQNPNTTDSGDLKGKFQVIITLPDGKQIIYDKSAVLVSSTKHVIRTRLQTVYDVDNRPKYHYWYDQPDLGFTYKNGDKYSAYNRYENLTQIDYCRTNRLERFAYDTYTKKLTDKGSMQYRKIFEKKEVSKTGFDSSKTSFLDAFKFDVKDRITYKYTNEADGYGYSGYNADTYKYATEKTEANGTVTKYTYNGIHEQVNTEEIGKDHKIVSLTEYDERKFPKKIEKTISSLENGAVKGQPVKKIENFRYDEHGNLTNYTGPIADRDEKGYTLNEENTVVYTYAYNAYDVLTSKTWKQDKNTSCQIIYILDEKGNVIKEKRVHTGNENSWLVTDYEYDGHGNMTQKTVKGNGQDCVTTYEYGTDAGGVDQKGAYLTKQYSIVDNKEISKKYAYDFNTGNMKAELDGKENRTSYAYDDLSRITKITYPDNTEKSYTYNDYKDKNREIQYTDPKGNNFLYKYDIFGNQVDYSVYDKEAWHTILSDEYDSQGNKIKETDANGNSAHFTYNSENNLIKKEYYEKDTTRKESLTLGYTYGADSETNLLLTLTDEDGYQKLLHYDQVDRLVKSEETADKMKYTAATYKYDYVGNKTSETDQRENPTKYTYDDLGRLVSKKDARNNETIYTYNSLDKPETIEEPGGRVTKYTYDDAGRTTEERIFDKASPEKYTYKKYTYDLNNNVASQAEGKFDGDEDTLSAYASYEYNNMDKVSDEYVKIDSKNTAHTKYEYDHNGNKTAVTEYTDLQENGKIRHSYQYDYADRVIFEEGVMNDETGAEHGHYIKKSEYDYAGNKQYDEEFNGTDYDRTDYKYDYRNRVTEKTEPFTGSAKKTTAYGYDKRGNLTSETLTRLEEAIITQYQYDGKGKVTAKIDPMGYVTKYLYDENGNLTKEIDPRYSSQDILAAPGTEYEYDELNTQIKQTAFDGKTKTVISYREYDGRGNVTKEADGEGYNSENPAQSFGSTYEYDSDNKVITYKSAQAAKDGKYTKKYTYDGSGRALTETDPYGNTTTNTYYKNGLLKQKTYADNTTESYEYDLTGKAMSKKTDRAKNVTTVYNNIFGMPYKTENPDKTTEAKEYTTKGELSKSTDRAGNPAYYEYDKAGNQTAKKEYIATNGTSDTYRLTKNTYDEAGNLKTTETFQLTAPKGTQSGEEKTTGNKTVYTYDKNSHVTLISAPLGQETINGYDKAGNLVTQKQKIQENDYQINRYEYDTQSRPTAEILLAETSDIDSSRNAEIDSEYTTKIKAKTGYTYYNNGQLKTKADANGNITAFEYDLDKNAVKKTDALKNETTYSYDLRGNLLEEKNAKGIATKYEYDCMNRLIRKKAPSADGEQAVTRYIYDEMGNLKKQINPNEYSAQKDTPELAETMKGTAYTYDSMNRRLTTVQPDGSTVEYLKYDANGNLEKKVDGLRYNGSIEDSKGTVYSYDGLGRVTKTTDALVHSKSYEYDVLGNVTKTTDERGNTTRYTYNADGTLANVTYADGGTAEYTYDRLGRKTSQKDQRGNTTEYTYNSFGTVKTEKDAYGSTIENKADLTGNVTLAKDKNGSITYITYDALSRPVKKKLPLEKDAAGSILYTIESYSYDALGNVTQKEITGTKDKLSSRTITYTYYDNNLVSTVTDSSGAYAKSYYDKNGNTVKTERLSTENIYDIQKYEYDSMNRLTKDIRLVDEEDIYNSAGFSNLENLRDSEYPGKLRMITAYEYDILGNKTKVTSPLAFAYKENDTKNRESYVTTYTYDLLNRLEKVTRKYNGTDVSTSYTYDNAGNKETETNERGYTTKYTYDSQNRVQSITDAENNTLTYTYDLSGNKLTETNAKGDTMTYAYDKLNRLQQVTDAYQKIISRRVYDANGNVVKEIDAKGYKSADNDEARYGTVYTYNLANQLTAKATPEAAAQSKNTITYEYSQYGEVTKQTDALGNSTKYEYDGAGKLRKITDALGVTTKYTYDKQGNKLTMTDGRGKLTSYAYGAFGRLKAVTNADSRSETYKYDFEGNTACITDKNGSNTVCTYDNRGLLTEKKVTETNESISYTYDEAGNRKSMTDESGISSCTYDRNNRLLEIRKNNTLQISYVYDKIGNIEKVTDLKGNETSYTYDKSSRMETVTGAGKTTIYTYDENGRRQSVTYAGGVTESYAYDKDNQLVQLTNKKPNGVTISEYKYTYDLAGRQLTKTDSYGTTNYEYDKAGRITKEATPGKTTVYAYDKAGNRLSQNETYNAEQPSQYIDEATGKEIQYILKKSQYTYTNTNELARLEERIYDSSNKELARKTTKYTYDSNGNQQRQSISHTLPDTTKLRPSATGTAYGDNVTNSLNTLMEKTSYTYDGFNRLKKAETIKDGKRTTAEYVYNGDGLRVSKTVKKSENSYAAETTNYLYDRQNVILETDGSNNVKARYIKGINYIAKADAQNNITYFLYNGHGDVVQTTDEAGTIQNQYDYDIWGNPTLTVETSENAIRYSGEFMDAETGLYYLRARYYDSYTGRFTTEDSYWGEDENPLSLNLYTYCYNNPISYTDPTGHYVSDWDKSNLSKSEIKQLEQYGNDYKNAGNTAAKAAAHANAEALRDKYRSSNEVGTTDGHTATVSSASASSSSSRITGTPAPQQDMTMLVGKDKYIESITLPQNVTQVDNYGIVGNIITLDNSNITLNNYNIINTLTTGKSSSLVLNNSGKITAVKIGENGTAEIYNHKDGYINSITGGDITNQTDKGMYIENRGIIDYVHTGSNSRNVIDNEEGKLTLETGEGNETIIINGQKGISIEKGKGKAVYRLYYPGGGYEDVDVKNVGRVQVLINSGSFFNPRLDQIIQKIKTLEQLCEKYYWGQYSIGQVMAFIRRKYDGLKWDLTAGAIDEGFVNYVKKNNLSLFNYFSDKGDGAELIDPVTKGKIDFQHMIVSAETFLITTPQPLIDSDFNDLAGWAGDLQQAIGDLQRYQKNKKTGNNLNRLTTAAKLIIADRTGKYTAFSINDMLADVDAYNIGNSLNSSSKLSEVLQNYYSHGVYNRYSNFVDNIGGLSELRKRTDLFTINARGLINIDILEGNKISKITDNQRKALSSAFMSYIKSNMEK